MREFVGYEWLVAVIWLIWTVLWLPVFLAGILGLGMQSFGKWLLRPEDRSE